jgi:catechol 2,3-dioxygenase-like lactoylglutathione lyase family enzyme
MILGLSHVGVTVRELNESLRYYRETLGFEVLSDSERKGEWIEKITGIPGFHTRTVYITVTPYKQLELFGFYHPKTLPAETDTAPRVGIPYCVFLRQDMGTLLESAEARKAHERSDLMRNTAEEPYRGCRVVTLRDPSGLNLRVVEQRNEEKDSKASLMNASFYPVLIVENIESSLQFYQDVVGLEIASQGVSPPEVNAYVQNGVREPV